MGRTLKTIANQGDQNKLGAVFQAGRLGSAIALLPRFYKGAVASHVMTLPENARARVVLAAFATAGTVTGSMTPVPGGAPTTGQVGITATGNIVFATADAVTAAEVYYVTWDGEIIEEIVPVVSHVATPSSGRGAALLLSATATTGGVVGNKTVDFRGAAIATGEAGINLLGTGVTFATADTVTQARIKYVATPGVGVGKPAIGANWDTDETWAF
jgi:hypothetical protein